MNKNLGNLVGAAKVGVCLGVILALSSNSYASNEAAGAVQFELHIVENTTGGREIVAGDYNAAIEKIRVSLSMDSKYVESTNLCAAYIAEKEYIQAEAHCKAALRASRSFDTGLQSTTWGRTAAKANRAVALNNLGVLHALKGNNREAREFFQSASKRSYRLKLTSDRNINVLEQRMVSEVANS
jgi:tetratricopeptide (TPR) repeat protein